MNPSILLVEDSVQIQMIVSSVLKEVAEVTIASNLSGSEEALNLHHFDLILLDVTLPDGNGFEYCEQLRSRVNTKDIPIFFLTGKDQLSERLHGFASGGDDYLSKPFHPEELRARVQARLRRQMGKLAGTNLEYFAGFIFNTGTQEVQIEDDPKHEVLRLTPTEYRLLHFFARHLGKVIQRHTLVAKIWGEGIHLSDRVVDTHASSLRRAISGYGYRIESIYRVGYCFSREKAAPVK